MEHFDVILLLGLKLNPDGTPRQELRLRTKLAARLWKRGIAPRIVCCGGPTALGITEAEVMANLLREKGVPDSALVLEDQSMFTVENIRNAKAILGQNVSAAALVTSDYHVFRARRICRGCGFRTKGFCAKMPKEQHFRDCRRMEPLFLLDYYMNWSTNDRPPKVNSLVERLFGKTLARLRKYNEEFH